MRILAKYESLSAHFCRWQVKTNSCCQVLVAAVDSGPLTSQEATSTSLEHMHTHSVWRQSVNKVVFPVNLS